jgi:protein O-mannosyl-transferase
VSRRAKSSINKGGARSARRRSRFTPKAIASVIPTQGWPRAIICLGLVAITWIVFGQTLGFDFINYDDNLYVYEEAAINSGLTLHGLAAAFTHALVGNWHPLTSLSLMLDAQSFAVRPGGYHFSNVLLHTIAVLLLFLVLKRMTGALWRSAFVAALFAIHPLRVESVVWISERKDVLSGVFFMLTLGAYLRYARRPSVGSYLTVLATFVLGLLSKAMLVTLPFVLLLLDYWPLQRFAQLPAWNEKHERPDALPLATPRRLLLEKVPLLVLTAAASVATWFAQEQALKSSQGWLLSWRINNALITIWIYLRQMFWPTDLALFYPHPKANIPLWEAGLALLLLLATSAAAINWRKRYPYLVTGWFWYLGMLIPVLGLVQVGLQAHADRYTYLPQIGIYLLLTWAIGDLTRSWQTRRAILSAAAGLLILASMSIAWKQAGYWSNSQRLWTHVLEVTQNNDVAERGLGTALLKLGRVDEAITHDREALRLRPGDPDLLTNLANALVQKKEFREAIEHYRAVAALRPGDSEARRNLGKALLQSGPRDEGLAELREALRIQPNDSDASYSLGSVFLEQGDLDDAVAYFRKAIESDAKNHPAHYNLAIALSRKGQLDDAIAEFREALRLRPEQLDVYNNLAIALLRKGQIQNAIAAWRKALQLEPRNAEMHNNLAVALLQAGRSTAAVAEWQETLRLDPDKIGTQMTLAWILSTSPDAAMRNGTKALEFAQRADQISSGRNLMVFRVRAAAYAEIGRFPEAITAAQEGAQRAAAEGQSALFQLLQGDLALYQQGVPLRDPTYGRGAAGTP